MEFAKWILRNPKAIEVWGIDGAMLLTVDSTSSTSQNIEMDSGDWILVRVSGLPETPGLGVLRFTRQPKQSSGNNNGKTEESPNNSGKDEKGDSSNNNEKITEDNAIIDKNKEVELRFT